MTEPHKSPAQKLTRAMHFAARKHSAQRRKGEDQEPYVNHLAEVAELLAANTAGENTDLICAGLLHDSIEDTETRRDELVREFGENVADIVSEVTDDKSLSKQERKRLQVENTPHKSAAAKMIKMADKISNMRSTIDNPPADWDIERKQQYFEWSKKVVAGCRGVNPGLEAEFDRTYQRGVKALGIKPA